MTGSGREALPDVRDWSGGLLGGREAYPDVREPSVGPPGCPRVVGKPFQLSGSSREALLDVWEWLGGPAG